MRACAVVVVAIVAACGKDDCERAFETEQKCSARSELVGKDVFVLACNAALKNEALKGRFQAQIDCAKEESCEAYRACGKTQRGRDRARDVTQAIEKGAWKEAWDDCTLIADYYADPTFRAECVKVFATAKLEGEDAKRALYRCRSGAEIRKAVAELDQACQAMTVGQLATAKAAAIAARDAGKRDFKACFELKQLAETAGGDAVASAKALCDELERADDAKQAIDEAHANVAAKKADVPFKCQYATDQLAQLDTEWAKRTLDAVLEACYVELGAAVLAIDPKDARYSCPTRVKRVKDAIAKFELAARHPELAAVIAKLPRTCKK